VTWLGISGRNKGHGDGTVSYSVQSNTTTSSRTGILIIAGEIFTVDQTAASALFFSQVSSGAEWESAFVLTNPSAPRPPPGRSLF